MEFPSLRFVLARMLSRKDIRLFLLDSVKQHGRLNDNHLGRLDGDDCRRLLVHVVAPVNV
jgi:hypothetical protein